MATRKLKLKPKPTFTSSIRRVRERDEGLELPAKEVESSVKEQTPTEEKIPKPPNGVSTPETPLSLNPILKELDDPTRQDTLKVANENNLVGSVIVSEKPADGEILVIPNHPNHSSVSLQDRNSASLNEVKSITRSGPSHENARLIAQNINKETLIKDTSQEPNRTTSACEQNINTDTFDLTKDTSQESDKTLSDRAKESFQNKKDETVSSNQEVLTKSNVARAASRFRPKPILSCAGQRGKSYIADSSKSETSQTNVRTESVIKSVQSELNKVNPIVSEITESFFLLEEEEPELCPIKNNVNEKRNDSIDNFSNNTKNDHNMASYGVENSFSSGGNNNKTNLEDNHIEINNSNLKSTLTTNKVSFSPVKPSSKILVPKPSPRLSDIGPRRVSFQGSDNEDEIKRRKPLNRNENKPITTKVTKEKTLKNTKRKRSQGSTYSKMGQETLDKLTKKFGKSGDPDKTKLTMIDLIFYNPKSNPMSVNNQQPASKRKEDTMDVSEGIEKALEEEQVDDVEPTPLPVPQLKIGPDGQIMLDPQSLVIETTGTEKGRAELEKSKVVQETGITRYSTYSKRKSQRKDWTPQETLQFFKALNTIGSDFNLMTKLFPKRTRHELKLKFKKEEKVNLHLVDKAMTDPADFDFESLKEEINHENEELEKKNLEKKLAVQSAKRERAMKKTERLMKKEEKTKGAEKKEWFRRGAALKDFNESDTGKSHNFVKKKPKRPYRKKKKVSPEFCELDDDSDLEDLQIDMHSDSSEDGRVNILHAVKQTRLGRVPKYSSKLKEYEEINETLKRKLENSEDEGYVPNGSDAHMLFGTPLEQPAYDPLETEDNRQWDIKITSIPTVEETVFTNSNIEEVSEISELGSFGQNDTALDLSLPVRANIPKEILHLEPVKGSTFSRQIAESFQIIDQLTSNVGSDGPYFHNEITNTALTMEVQNQDNPGRNSTPLPSFESVSRSRPSMMFPLETNYIPEEGNTQSLVTENDYYNSDECILGD